MHKNWSKLNLILPILSKPKTVDKWLFFLVLLCNYMLKERKKHYFKPREFEYFILWSWECWTALRARSYLQFSKVVWISGSVEIVLLKWYKYSPERKWWRITHQWSLTIFNPFIVDLLVLVPVAWET